MAERETLSSRLGFILLSAGCAIGLGNVWRFPYITGRYGGAAFVLIYLVFLLILGLPVMVMEFSIGRAGKMNIVGAYKTLEPKKSKWHIAGPFALFGNYMLLFFYIPITGWLLYYFISSIGGTFAGMGTEEVGTFFNSMLASPLLQYGWGVIALVITALIALGGLKNSVEKVSKVMMAMLFVLMIALAIHSATLNGAKEGLLFFLKPDLNNLVEYGIGESLFAAMGQAFFTLSLGIGAMSIMGSYFSDERSLTGESVRIVCLDTSIALLAGLIIFPACSAFSIEAGSGPSLLFITLPNVFAQMTAGSLWAALFFLAMSFASLTTLIAVFENILAYWMDMRGYTRKKAAFVNVIIFLICILPCILGFNVLSGFTPFGEGTGIMDLEDFIVSNLLLPLGSLVMVLFCTSRYGWGWNNFIETADKGEGLKFPNKLRFYCAYILPLIILFVTVKGIYDIIF